MERLPLRASLIVVAFAIVWTATMLRRNNLDRQGGDVVHHALLVQEAIDPRLPAPPFFQMYPRLSHRIAAWFSCFFDGDSVQAMRCAALVALGLMTLFQFELLRSNMSFSTALAVLFAWQFVCTLGKVGNINHFLWEGQYNYARAVGAVGMWLTMLTLAIRPLEHGRLRALMWPLLGAVFATSCHLVPGALAFGIIVLFYSCQSFVRRSWSPLSNAGLAAAVGIAAFMMSKSREMAAISAAGGWMPVALEPLLWMWAPVAIGAVAWLLINRRQDSAADFEKDSIGAVLIAASGASSALQCGLLIGRLAGRVSEYSYNSALFYAFQFASLLLIHAMAMCVCHWRPQWRLDQRPIVVQRSCQVAALLIAVLAIGVALKRDARRPYFGANRDPVRVVWQLRDWPDRVPATLYIDPDQPLSSYYVNLSISRFETNAAMEISDQIREGIDMGRLLSEHEIGAIVLPREVNPGKSLRANVAAVARGNFWIVHPSTPETIGATPVVAIPR